jgi:CHAT domain-containing protein/tetratricopeptide (TPR) repeat protein
MRPGFDASALVNFTGLCPQCKSQLSTSVWRIVDASARPDLVRRLVDGTLQIARCRCGYEAEPDTPLLIWRPDSFPALAYVPSRRGFDSSEFGQAEAAELYDELRATVADHRQFMEPPEVVSVLPEALRPVLTRDVAADVRAHQRGERPEGENGIYGVLLRDLASDHQAKILTRGLAENHLRLTEEAIASFTNAKDHAPVGSHDWLTAVTNLGIAYAGRRTGDPEANIESAIRLYESALAHCTGAERRQESAAINSNLGIAYRRRLVDSRALNIEESLRCYRRALELSDNGLDVAIVKTNLATAYLTRAFDDPDENCRKAAALCREAIPTIEEDANDELVAKVRLALGNALVNSGDEPDLDEATHSFSLAAERYARAGRPIEAALAKVSLGQASLSRGDDATAIRVMEAAVLELPTAEWPWAKAHYTLALAYRRTTRLAEAVRHLEQSLAVLTPETYPFDAREAARELGETLSELGQWRAAAEAFRTALDAADRLYQVTVVSAARDVELSASGSLHRNAAYVLARNGDASSAVQALERGRAQWLALSMGPAQTAERLRPVIDASELKELDEALAELRLVAVFDRGLQSFEADTVRFAGKGAVERRARVALADIDRLAVRHGIVDPAKNTDNVRSQLEPHEALAYLTVARWGSAALLVDRTGAHAVRCDSLNASLLSELITRGGALSYLGTLLTAAPRLAPLLDELLAKVGATLVVELAAAARALDIQRLTLIATGALGLVPLHAAPYRSSNGTRCLVDEFAIAYAPSAFVWSGARSRSVAWTARRTVAFVGVADPLPSDVSLPSAVAEAQVIAESFPKAKVLAHEEATKAATLAAISEATHVHLACHGQYVPDRPLASYLQLAGDEVLTLHELLDRGGFEGVRLVTASSCQSAMARHDRIPDEAVGFPSGFLHAGAAGVVGAMWPVEDLPAALLATHLYSLHLDGLEPAAALAAAQRWLRSTTNAEFETYLSTRPGLADTAKAWLIRARRGPTAQPFVHPVHWAAYMLVGT